MKLFTKGNLIINTASNIGYFAVSLLVGLCFTPYLINHLGVENYGMIPLVTTIIGYMGVFTLALNSAVGRFLTIAIEQKKDEVANRIFNTSLFGLLTVVLILALLSCVAISNVEHWLRIRTDSINQIKLLLAYGAVAFLLNAIKSVFDVVTYCLNRFDLRNAIALFDIVVRIGVVICLFAYTTPQIWHVSFGQLFASFLSLLCAIYMWKLLAPTLSISYKCFNWRDFRSLFAMAGWISVSTLGTMLLLGIDLLVVNRVLDAESVGKYAAIMQWPAVIRGLAANFSGVLGPSVIYAHAKGTNADIVIYIRRSVKIIGLIIGLLVGIMCGFSRPLLQLWLGASFGDLWVLMFIMTIHLGLNLGYLPLHHVSVATNNVRVPGLVQVAAGFINLFLALIMANWWGMYGVALAGAIVLSLRNLVFTPLYAAHILNQKKSVFLKEFIPIGTSSVLVAFISWNLSNTILLSSWLDLAAAGMVITVLYCAIIYSLVLSRDERNYANTMFRLKTNISRWLS